MKSDSQFVRWGIPGWTMAVSFIIFILIDYVSANDDRMYLTLNNAFQNEAIWTLIIAGFLTAGAGIPIGFLIYQIYFYLRWVSPVSKNGFFPPFLHGRMTEMKDSLRNIDIYKLSFNKQWRKVIIEETKDHRSIWHYISPILHEALLTIDKDDILHKHLNYLKETLHSLGASHLGFSFGFLAYLIMKWKSGQAPLIWLLVVLPVTLCNIYFLSKEDHGRKRFHDSSVYKKIETPAELFISSLFFLYATLNPAFNRLIPYNLLWVTLIGLAFIWGKSAHENKWEIWGLAVLLTILAFFIYNSPWYIGISQTLNWPVILSILIFNSITIVFLKIRQNTVDSLTTFQYYLTMLFLEKRKTKL